MTSRSQSPAILNLIGNTPLLEVSRMDTGPCTLNLKLESQNPGGSIKDRIAVSMIDGAERRGDLRVGGTIVEATAGNTGLGLALVGRLKGYRVAARGAGQEATEKVQQLKALGAQVRITRSDVGKGIRSTTGSRAELAGEIPGAFFANQFENLDNPRAHVETTGPEIWQQVGQQLDAVVVGVGSSGTLTGLTQYSAGSPARGVRARRPEGFDSRRSRAHGYPRSRRFVESGGDRRGLRPIHRRLLERASRLYHR